jgi:hypothetical protein
MEPDFYLLSQDLAVPELVKVAKTPSDYMPEAVIAAERILKERGISREEIAAEEWVIAQKEMSDGLRKSRRGDFLSWVGALFGRDKLSSPGERGFAVFLLCYCLFYVYMMYAFVSQLAWLSHCVYCPPSPGTLIAWNLGMGLYMTVCLYCILRQVWLGWSLMFIHLIYSFSMNMARLFRFYAHHFFPHNAFSVVVFPAVVVAGLSIFLWRPHMLATFKINATTRNRTLLAAAFLGIVAMFIA